MACGSKPTAHGLQPVRLLAAYFNAPPVIPLTKLRCTKLNSTATGTVAMTPAAIIRFQKTMFRPAKSVKASDIGLSTSFERKTSGNSRLFQPAMNA